MSPLTPALPDDVDIAIVTHNGRGTLPRVLASLEAAGAAADRITLVDIASTDDTAAWLAAHHPAVRLERLAENVGPNPARNRAIERASRPFLLLLDADAYVWPDAIVELRSAMRPDERVAGVVPVVVHDEAPDRIQYAGASLHFICEAINPWQDRPLADRGQQTMEIGTAPGLCCLIDVGVARKLGGFDERYFMGKEDGEFWYRLRVAGYRLVETPRAVVLHASRPRSMWLFPFQLRNRWHFMLKNYELATLIALAPALLIHEPLQAALLVTRGQAGAWVRGVRALVPWLRSLRAERDAVRAGRTVHDRDLLGAAPLAVRADLVGGGAGPVFKRAYDAWLRVYWRLASSLLP